MRAHQIRSSTSPPPTDDPGDRRLVELIREEIESGGPITFARFMDRALYEPDLGYYATSTTRTTAQGDFVTAPELHPVFGWTVARQVDQMWQRLGRPDQFVVREFGAGSGALILSLLDGLREIDSPLAATLLYDPVDLPAQRELIRGRLAAAGDAARLLDLDDFDDRPMTGVVLANEFLDALPLHRVIQRGGELREIYVDWRSDGFVEVEGEPSDDEIKGWFLDAGVTLADTQQAEVSLGLLEWIDLVEAELERGFVVVIDYGADSAELYGATRMTGTLRAFAGHHVSSDVLHGVGRRDITAHVDFGALERAARGAGLEVLGQRRMSEFLLAAGLDDAYAAARATADEDWDSAATLRAAVRRMLDPAALGGYQVAILGKGIAADAAQLNGLEPLRRQGRDAR